MLPHKVTRACARPRGAMPGFTTFYVAASGALLAAVVGTSLVKHPADSVVTHFTRSNLSILVRSLPPSYIDAPSDSSCLGLRKCGVQCTRRPHVFLLLSRHRAFSLAPLVSESSIQTSNVAAVARPTGARPASATPGGASSPAVDPAERHSLLEMRKKKLLEESRAYGTAGNARQEKLTRSLGGISRRRLLRPPPREQRLFLMLHRHAVM